MMPEILPFSALFDRMFHPKICIRSRKPDVRGVKTLEGLKRFNVELGIQRDI